MANTETKIKGNLKIAIVEIARLLRSPAAKLPQIIDDYIDLNVLIDVRTIQRWLVGIGAMKESRKPWGEGHCAVHSIPISWREKVQAQTIGLCEEGAGVPKVTGRLLLVADRKYSWYNSEAKPGYDTKLNLRTKLVATDTPDEEVAEQFLAMLKDFDPFEAVHFVQEESSEGVAAPTALISPDALTRKLPEGISVHYDSPTKGGKSLDLPLVSPSLADMDDFFVEVRCQERSVPTSIRFRDLNSPRTQKRIIESVIEQIKNAGDDKSR